MKTVRIPDRLNGPPGSGHGGTACGLFAGSVNDQLASVTLLKPPPLGTDIEVREGNGKFTFIAAGDTIAVAERSLPLDVPALPYLPVGLVADASQEFREYMEEHHPFPTCFGCGPRRPDNDGLELFAGAVGSSGFHACMWVPGSSLSDDGREVSPWAVWAALDCPSGHVVLPTIDASTEAIVLARLSVEIRGPIQVDAEYEIVASASKRDGRKSLCHSAIVAPDGTNLAIAIALWITIPIP